MFFSVIDNLDPVLRAFAGEVEKQSGFKVHMMIGGPEPRRNGRTITYALVFWFLIIASMLFSVVVTKLYSA